MKLKLLILTALMSYSSISSAFTLYNCKSLDTELNQQLTISEELARVPIENISVKLTSDNNKLPKNEYFLLYPQKTETIKNTTINTFSNQDVVLNIVTETSLIFGPKNGPVAKDGSSMGGLGDYYCGRAPCKHYPKYPIKQKTNILAILINGNDTTTFQCND